MAKSLILIYIFVVVTLNFKSHAQNIESQFLSGINVTKRELFPYQVSIRNKDKHICGGTIYNTKQIITSASCISDIAASNLEIISGDLNLLRGSNHTQKIKVNKVIVHEKFNKTQNDIAVLQLSKKLKFDNFTNSIQVFKHWNGTNTTGGKCLVSGWGANVTQAAKSNDLRYDNVSIFSNDMCGRLNGTFCAGNNYNLENLCVGDAGGPLVCNGALYGIVSLKTQCNISNKPGVYTNATYYEKWIRANHGDKIQPAFLLLSFILFGLRI